MSDTETTRLAYKPREVAELLGVCERTVYRMIHENELPWVRRGKYLIPAKGLEEWLANAKVETGQVA